MTTSGGSPSTPTGAASVPSSSANDMRRLVRFYEFYAPDRVESAALTLESYKGRVDLLFRALEKKYGPEQRVPNTATVEGNTPRDNSAPTTGNAVLAAAAPQMPSPLPSTFSTVLHFHPVRSRLERFYRHYAEEKGSESAIAAALEAYNGREDVLFRDLERKYGPEPRAFVVVTPRKTKSSLPSATRTHNTNTANIGDDDDNSAFFVDPSVVGPSAGPDPKTVLLHAPYDYHGVLRNLGLREDAVERELAVFGAAKLPYAASITILTTLIGQEALYDVDPDKTPPFPFHALKEFKRANPDSIDGFAFDHLLRYRAVFTAAIQHVVYVRHLEHVERQQLWHQHMNDLGNVSRRVLVLRRAVDHVEPLESERRECIEQEEKIRLDGVVLWFRQKRLEIVSSASSASLPLTPRHAPPSATLDVLERQLRRINDEVRQQSDALVAKWSHEPPPSTIRSMMATTPLRNATKELSSSVATPSVAPQAQAANARGRFSSKPSTTAVAPAVAASPAPSVGAVAATRGRTKSPHQPSTANGSSALWLPSGPSLKSHHAAPPVPEGADNRGTANLLLPAAAPIVVRENLHFDPFGRDDRSTGPSATPQPGFVTRDGLLLCAAPRSRSRTPSSSAAPPRSHSPATYRTASTSGPGRSESAGHHTLQPYEIERQVRLKKITSRGSFSEMRHCAATEAKRYFAVPE